MEKITVELNKHKDFPKGYGLTEKFYPDSKGSATQSEMFEKMCEVIPKGKRHIEHFYRTEWLPYNPVQHHIAKGHSMGDDHISSLKIPTGVLTEYLDIFVEDNYGIS